MAQIVFYEKPGCINNVRQKNLLRQAGHTILVRNLLSENWTADASQLRAFFAGKPVSEWFNRSAPVIKQGLIDPERLDELEAIDLMLVDPLLIRRPLMQVGAEKMAGFNEQEVDSWIGLSMAQKAGELETCPKERQPGCSHG